MRAAASGLNRYNDPDCTALCEAIGAANGLDGACVMPGNGSDQVLFLSFLAFADEEHPLLMPDITYSYYDDFAAVLPRPVRRVPLKEDLSLDAASFCAPGCVPVIANPNAPTGLALSLGEIKDILEADERRAVILDEAYFGFGAESAVSLIDNHPNLLVIRTFSKGLGLAGARLGYALGQKEIIDDLKRVRSAVDLYGVSAMAQAAGLAALNQWDVFLENCSKIVSTREWTRARLEEMGFRVVPSLANFLFAAPPVNAGKMAAALKERRILIRHWDRPRVRDYLRITIGTQQETETFCDTVFKILKEGI